MAEKLTKEQQGQTVADFSRWSGGFLPDECDAEQLHEYATAQGNNQDEILDFLMYYAGMIPGKTYDED